ncbi:MAG: hypothetical protein ACPGF7_14445 [Pontibacterium sp.]
MAGLVETPCWLAVDWLLSAFASNRGDAIERYIQFVKQGGNQPSPWEQLKNQIYLGDDAFVESVQCKMPLEQSLDEIPGAQKRQAPQSLNYYADKYPVRDEAISKAYKSGGFSLKEIGEHFGLHYSRVSRIVKRQRQAKRKT